jgi:hypothetical protein
MPYDAGNRRDVREAEKAQKVADQQRREVVSGIMSVAPGRKWMCELLEACHVFATSYSDVSLRMAFCEGQRDVGIRLLTDIMGACPDDYILMMRERNERQSSTDARLDRKDRNGRDKEPGPDYDPGSDYTADDDYDGAEAQPS